MNSLDNLELRYPHELVHQYGAKAGILMYVQDQCPQIPQMPMVVKEIGESERNFLKRVDEAQIGNEMILRSSAVAELVGYEGEFPTTIIRRHKRYQSDPPMMVRNGDYILFNTDEELETAIEAEIRKIATSPKFVKHPGDQLPSEINVIAADVAPSKFRGTLIQHPHIPNSCIATVWEANDDRINTTFISGEDGQLTAFGHNMRRSLEYNFEVRNRLPSILDWHDKIASLPDMDPDWSYQIEFGLEPEFLFQVRPFRKKLVSPFNIPYSDESAIIIGTTPPEGLDFVVENSAMKNAQDNIPTILTDSLRFATRIGHYRTWDAYLLNDGGGILKHDDIRLMRHATLSIVNPWSNPFFAKNGSIINIISDGRTYIATDKATGEILYYPK